MGCRVFLGCFYILLIQYDSLISAAIHRLRLVYGRGRQLYAPDQDAGNGRDAEDAAGHADVGFCVRQPARRIWAEPDGQYAGR